MDNKSEISVEDEIHQLDVERPHVVVLGSGASRAVCPEGDKNGKALPLFADFTKVVGLAPLLGKWGINVTANFEEVFSDLAEKKESEKIREIEDVVEPYFNGLELPDNPTIYDHLLLSLREKDIVATFNWDPLLMQAYSRNGAAGFKMPRLAFLHGNVTVGYCGKDKKAGLAGMVCKKCGDPYDRVPLLYPIKKKDYSENLFISNEWKTLKDGFRNAFMITIFGYSGPRTDQEAIGAMKEAWGNKYGREMEQTAFITIQSEDEVRKNWEPFIHTHHYEVHQDFYDSWIANHPRRTGEAWINQYIEAKYISNNPVPKHLGLAELWHWFEPLRAVEGE